MTDKPVTTFAEREALMSEDERKIWQFITTVSIDDYVNVDWMRENVEEVKKAFMRLTAPRAQAPQLSDEAWEFIQNEGQTSPDFERSSFEGDWGNWNWFFSEIWKRCNQSTQAPADRAQAEGKAEMKEIVCPYCGDKTEQDIVLNGFTCGVCDKYFETKMPDRIIVEPRAQAEGMRVAEAQDLADKFLANTYGITNQDEWRLELVKFIEDLLQDARQHSAPAWEAFETAPKDGTEILVYRQDAGVFTAHFVSPSEFVKDGDDEPDWFTTSGEHLSGRDLPTHWMPLPASPFSKGARK